MFYKNMALKHAYNLSWGWTFNRGSPVLPCSSTQACSTYNNSTCIIPWHQQMMQPFNILKLSCDHQSSVTIHFCCHDSKLQTGAIFNCFCHSHVKKWQCSCVDGNILSQVSLILVIRVLKC